MARLCSSYALCPLIEQRNFLGVSEDSVAGCVIVTLAKNIVIRYKLSDQKQVNSWSSKDKLSSPVVYDYVGKRYIGVFNGDKVAFWQDNFVLLNRIKKYRFVMLIHSILTAPGLEPVIVFKNGHVSPLSIELDNRNQTLCQPPLAVKEEVEDAKIISIAGIHYVYVLIRSPQKYHKMIFVPVDSEKVEKSTLQIKREDNVTLTACAVIDIETSQLVTFWSDGKMFSLDLPLKDDSEAKFPGRFISLLCEINPSLPAAMVPISQVHVAIYGADPNSEGAVLAIYNIKFGIVQTSSHSKLYVSGCPRLWRCGNSQLVLVMGSYLAVAPYHLAVPRLATMIGAHLSQPPDPPPLVSWDTKKRPKKGNIPPSFSSPIEQRIWELRSLGITERAICNEIMPTLLEKSVFEDVHILLQTLSEVPEEWVFRTVLACLKARPTLKEEVKDEKRVKADEVDSNEEENMEIEGEQVNLKAENEDPVTKLLVEVLEDHPLVQDRSTLALARSHLDLPNALSLLRLITSALDDSPKPHRLLDWATLLLDTHYQQYLLSKDSDVLSALTAIKKIIDRQMEYMKDLQVLDAYILQLQRGKCFSRKGSESNKSYLVEKIRLY